MVTAHALVFLLIDENDYLLISSTFGLFDNITRSLNFTVLIIDDDISEPPEDFFLTILGDEYLQIVPNISIITIMDNPSKLVIWHGYYNTGCSAH